MSYMTLVDTIAENADRHVARGLQHYGEGRPEYAAGSFKKALRNYANAARCGALFAPQDEIDTLAAWRLKMEISKQQASA